MRYLLYSTFALYLILTSCDKRSRTDPNEHRIRIKTNAPVKTGEKLKVWVEDIDPDLYYSLQHPLGAMYETSYSTDSANVGDGGVYVVSAYGHSDKKDSIFVKVESPPLTCTPPHNGLRHRNGDILYFTSGSREVTELGYEVWVYSNTEWMMFRFKSDDILSETAMYASTQNRSGIKSNQVYCYLIKYGVIHLNDPGQPVYLEIEGEKMIITVCNFLVHNDSFNETIDAKLTFSL